MIKHGDLKCVNNEGMPVYKNPLEKGSLIIQFLVSFFKKKLSNLDVGMAGGCLESPGASGAGQGIETTPGYMSGQKPGSSVSTLMRLQVYRVLACCLTSSPRFLSTRGVNMSP